MKPTTPPRLISLVPRRFEEGDFSGVPRFDWELRRVFPSLVSLADSRVSRAKLAYWALRAASDTVVITTSELSVHVPARLRTIVVEHGCAQTHFERDETWRNNFAQALCAAQKRMFSLPNRWFVAPSHWTASEFSRHYGVPRARVIPHWVEPFQHPRRDLPRKPVVLGDWRTFNKGEKGIVALRSQLPEYAFQPLQCTYATRQAPYQAADVYLSLSLSEGGSYAVSDAEACLMPIVMTNVGNVKEYGSSIVIAWQARDDVSAVKHALDAALAQPRSTGFFSTFTFETWKTQWSALVEEVCASPTTPALLV